MGRKKREFVDLTGKQFGRWIVVGLAKPKVDPTGREYETWTCRCTCEKHTVKDIYVQHLLHGNSKSCGCLVKETTGNNFRTHGKTKTRIHRIWLSMRRRCFKETESAYPNYGGRGITVCDEWKDDFMSFENWAISNGYDDYLTIDRIENDGNYSPSNCRWATYKEQANNRRSSRYFVVDGESKTAPEWSEIYGAPSYEILFRAYHGWTDEEAVKTPLHHKRLA
jgi:hypothetical protein